METSNFLGTQVVSPAPVPSVRIEISSISNLMAEMIEQGKHNSTSYRLLKTALSKLKDFQKLNQQD